MPFQTTYQFPEPVTALQILETSAEILTEHFKREGLYSNSKEVKQFLSCKLGHYEREVLAVMFLDNGNQLIEYRELFEGTVNSATVHPREVVKAALACNAVSIIFAHNHPSGLTTPSINVQ